MHSTSRLIMLGGVPFKCCLVLSKYLFLETTHPGECADIFSYRTGRAQDKLAAQAQLDEQISQTQQDKEVQNARAEKAEAELKQHKAEAARAHEEDRTRIEALEVEKSRLTSEVENLQKEMDEVAAERDSLRSRPQPAAESQQLQVARRKPIRKVNRSSRESNDFIQVVETQESTQLPSTPQNDSLGSMNEQIHHLGLDNHHTQDEMVMDTQMMDASSPSSSAPQERINEDRGHLQNTSHAPNTHNRPTSASSDNSQVRHRRKLNHRLLYRWKAHCIQPC